MKKDENEQSSNLKKAVNQADTGMFLSDNDDYLPVQTI